MPDRFDHAGNLARAGDHRAHRGAFWPPAEAHALFSLDIAAAAPPLDAQALALLDELGRLIEREWAACKASPPPSRGRFHDPAPVADLLARLAEHLPRDADRTALRLRAAAIRAGYTEEGLRTLAALDEDLMVVIGQIATWYGKQTGGLPTAFACRRDEAGAGVIGAACGQLAAVEACFRDLHTHLRLAALPAFVPTRLFFMAGEGNRHPKHIAYFLPEDEGVKRSPYKKTCYFANTHAALVERVSLAHARALLDLGGPLPGTVAALGPIPTLGVFAHEAGHFVHREGGVSFQGLNAADRWTSVVLQEAAADVFGLLALAEVLAPAAGATGEDAVAYHLAECLRYVDRGLGLFPDSDGMFLQLAWLADFGVLEIAEDGAGRAIRLSGSPDAVLAAFRALARVLADTLLAGDVERSLALARDFGPSGGLRRLAPLVARLAAHPATTIEYLQEPADAARAAVAMAS
ncbi:hypothetical protein [Stappia sp.]|uniref:hypothetical protein n=1 Tax=Stappia sp. TaxID=1870903 RepID=UPI003A996AF1